MFAVITFCPLLMALPVSETDHSQGAVYQTRSTWDEAANGPLPRYREGGTPPVDPNQSLIPKRLDLQTLAMPPTSGLIASPPEYAACDGVLFRYSTSAWSSVVTDCVVALTGDPAHDEVAYVVVSSASQQTSATNQFTAGGADMSKVVFFIMPNDSIWLRDYGPHFVWQGGTLAIVDSHYYPTRPLDNFVPTLLAEDSLEIPGYHMGLYYSGGNFQPDANRHGYITNLIDVDNPGFGESYIAELYMQHQGIDTLHIFPRLPSYVDGTGHIDMWLYLVDEDTAIVSQFLPGEDVTAQQITDAAARYLENELGYEVFRVPDHNGFHPFDPNCHYTYTNAFRVNDRIFIPSYGQGDATHLARDAEALAAWQAAAPEAEIIPINCYPIIYAAGAIHCIVMQVPRYPEGPPAAHLLSPSFNELLVPGYEHEIRWAAGDNGYVTDVDLWYSNDGGYTYDEPIAMGEPHDGSYAWQVPAELTNFGYVKVVAEDDEGQTTEAESNGSFRIKSASKHVYDFSTGAGINKWAYGYQTASWNSVNGIRLPASVSTEITALQSNAYDRIAYSDAVGGDTDSNRYRSPIPSSGWETTHVFEFEIEEPTNTIKDIELRWEGYGDACIQTELYVWNYEANQWGDGFSQVGENRYTANAAQNRDATLVRNLRSQFDRYVGPGRNLTLMVYGERNGQESMHDYVAVTVAFGDPDPIIPASSQWGVAILTMLTLVGATLAFDRKHHRGLVP